MSLEKGCLSLNIITFAWKTGRLYGRSDSTKNDGKVKGKVFFLLCLVAMLQTAVVKAQDVYVYTTGNYTPVAVSKQVSSIIFGSTALTLRSSDGSTSSVPYELFSYFRFYQTPIPLSIQSAAVGEASIDYDGGGVMIKLQRHIDLVELITATGAVARTYNPRSDAFRMDVSDMPSGIYLVKVTSAGKNYVKKIVRK